MPGRIPDNFIQELLARTDIVEIIGARLELQRAGREFKARSPFTNEKTPSFFVSPTKQMYFDFSSGKSGNVVGFVMDYDRVSFVEAIEILAQHAGLDVPREAGRGPTPELDGARAALARAADLFQAELKRSAPAQAYLAKRGINAATVARFNLGYAPDAWDFLVSRLPDPRAALAAGLVKPRDKAEGHYDVFRHRLMFPIRDTRGRVIGFGGRTLADDPAKYLNSPETAIFHKGRNLFGLYEARQAAATALRELIVVEGYIDAIMLSQHGVTNVVAALGTATTKDHAALLFRSASRVAFCFDGDRAGRSAAHRAIEPILPELRAGREAGFVFLPEGEDPDTLVQREGHDAFVTRIRQAEPLAEFLLTELAKDCDLATLAGRAKLVENARTPLARLEDGALRALLIEALAQRTRLPSEEVQRLLKHNPPHNAARLPAPAVEPAPQRTLPKSRALSRALQLLGERPAFAAHVTDLGQLARAPVPGIDELVAALEFFTEHPHSRASQFLEAQRALGRGGIAERVWAKVLPEMDEAVMTAEFDAAVGRLRRRALQARQQVLLEQLAREGPSDAANNELKALLRQLSGLEPV